MAKVTHGTGGSTLTGGHESWGNRDGGTQGSFCLRCSAWRGSLGLEPTPKLYVQHIVEVFREVRRVMRDDATLWLNMGDSYASAPQIDNYADPKAPRRTPGNRCRTAFLKPKDLCGIPWRVAFALQADGWWLRSDIIWHKTNPMPESVRDRPTKAHEYLFLLSKSKRYYYDQDAVREPITQETADHARRYSLRLKKGLDKSRGGTEKMDYFAPVNGRNRRSVWTISTQGFPGSHFAVFPEKLVEPCIKAGTSARGCCPSCEAGWLRVVEKQDTGERVKMPDGWATHAGGHGSFHRDGREAGEGDRPVLRTQTTGWRPGCECSGLTVIGDQPSKPSRKSEQSELSYIADVAAWEIRLDKWHQHWEALKPLYDAEPTIPCAVLDPFSGSGTVGLVAARLGRDAILCELNPEYVEMQANRIKDDSPMFNEVTCATT